MIPKRCGRSLLAAVTGRSPAMMLHSRRKVRRRIRAARAHQMSAPSRRIAIAALAGAFALGSGAGAGELIIHHRDLVRAGPGSWTAPGLVVPAEDPSLPLVSLSDTSPEANELRRLDARGVANGFRDVLYDNRDRDHSDLRRSLFPRLTHLEYGFELKAGNDDYGIAGRVVLPAVVIGNSSTAITGGPAPRSLTRYAMTHPDGPALSARLYINNHIYIYPEHRDHDDTDLFPANWPYTLTSQGSSGSDQVFLRALAMTLAAFPRETFEHLQKHGLVAPTLQMILRRNLAGVESREDYFTGLAHPVVFDGTALRPARMVSQAASLGPDEVPPMVRIEVVEEDFSVAAGLAGLDEHLFDTPSAIARLWRGVKGRVTLVVSAAETQDPNQRPVAFSWHLLRGDPGRVKIEPLDSAGSEARIEIDWHDFTPDPNAEPSNGAIRRTSRIDIGVFASNGRTDSAPAILSIAFPSHQVREYAVAGKGEPRLVSVDYDALGREAYYDPVLFWSAPWTDRARYGPDGDLLGWDRSFTDGRQPVFVDADAPTGAAYRINGASPGTPVLEYAP